jgi:hypothetical protein|tara:strand:+ start:88 stop:393 length:306 start_codon:yes stop_codon:yes gene_type:complete
MSKFMFKLQLNDHRISKKKAAKAKDKSAADLGRNVTTFAQHRARCNNQHIATSCQSKVVIRARCASGRLAMWRRVEIDDFAGCLLVIAGTCRDFCVWFRCV